MHIKLEQLNCLTDHPSCYVGLLKDLADGQISHHYHSKTMEVVVESPSCEYHHQSGLLNGLVLRFWPLQHLAHKVDWLLDPISLLHNNRADCSICDHKIKMNGST